MKYVSHLFLCACLSLSVLGFAGTAQGIDRNFVPVAGSIRSHKVNVRSGPGTRYPILWVYHLRGYPVKVIAKYLGWLKIRDIEGEEGWIYHTFFSNRKMAMVSPGAPVVMYADREGRQKLLRLEAGVLTTVERCVMGACEVKVDARTGWVAANRLLRQQDGPDAVKP